MEHILTHRELFMISVLLLSIFGLVIWLFIRLKKSRDEPTVPDIVIPTDVIPEILTPPSQGVTISGIAHIQDLGDVAYSQANIIGNKGSKQRIEGIRLELDLDVPKNQFQYRIETKAGTSEWLDSGKFCGSRRAQLPINKVAFRLREDLANMYTCTYFVECVDGTASILATDGDFASSNSLSPIEAIYIRNINK